MKNTLQYHNIQFIAVYDRNTNIRQHVFEYETALKAYFKNPFRTFAIPDDENPNIPRFETDEGNSSLTVNQERLTFSTFIKGLNDASKIKDIISKRIRVIKPLLLKEKINFIAYIIELHNVFDSNEEIFSMFKEHTKALPAQIDDLKEFSIFYAKPFNSDFYININCARFEEHTVKLQHGITSKDDLVKFGISVVLDLNSRYRYTNKEPFYPELFEKLETEAFEIISKNELRNYLSGEII